MKKDILTITSVALGTAALTVLTFWSAPIEAGNEAETKAPKVVQPKLVANGIEVTLLAAEGKNFQAGDEPAFALTAVNTTAKPATANLLLVMDSTSPSEAMSRRISMPVMLWRQECTLALKPNEKKTIPFASKTKLSPNQLVSVSMQTNDPGNTPGLPSPQIAPQSFRLQTISPGRVVALSFSTAIAPGQRMLAKNN